MNLPFPDVNSAQWKAISHCGSHLLIIAGPGTGKTHTLTYRIAHVLEELRNEEQILAVTFTRKAADQMQERLRLRFPDAMRLVTIGTFHSFCLQLLKRFIEATDLPADFQVAVPEDIESMVKELWSDKKSSERKKALEEISFWKSKKEEAASPLSVKEYDRFLRSHKFLDYDDLLKEAWRLLKENADVRNEARKMYRYIFVDEYQDINEIQHALLKALIGENNFLTVIGDPNQAIYGFRGSDVRFFESFKEDFSGAAVLTLSENYRSAANLLKASGQVIGQNDRFEIPELTAKIYTGGKLVIYEAPSERAEAEYVVHQIEQMLGGTSMFSMDSGRVKVHEEAQAGLADFAVLYRLNSQHHTLEEAFNRSGIPFKVSGDKRFDEEDIVERVQKVNLMTLHAAKGLEFPVVFIVGCEESLIPLRLERLAGDTEEERRLFYVGMTRAKEKLYLVRARRRLVFGKTCHNTPSPFLADIEEQLKAYEQAQRLPARKKKKETQIGLFE